MSLDDWVERAETVDPEVRAYVGSLVNAVGGTSIEEHGRYVLGDDAIGCLKDLRRWIRFYDEKLNRLDVQRVLAESNFVKGDILEMLSDWSETAQPDRLRSKVALLALELLVPLTWSLDIAELDFKINHHKHVPYLRLAQVEYKRAILQHDSKKILRQIIRVGLPSIAEARKDRSVRDDGIIKLVLYAIRNIAMISQPEDLPADCDEAEISRSTAIDVFHTQDVFQLLLTISSSMGEEFDVQDVVILEVLFHLLKGIDPAKLFMKDDQLSQSNTGELRELMRREKAMLSGYARYAPTRHNRFGTMLWLKRDEERLSTVSGQAAISGPNRGMTYLDKAKKVNRPKYGRRNAEENKSYEFDKEVPLSGTARKRLRHFVEEFLDSSFNPLFAHLRRSIERELDRVMDSHNMQFFYLVGWFLKAECARRAYKKQSAKNAEPGSSAAQSDDSFAIVAAVMNQETFILMHRYMETAYSHKAWHDVNAGMKCFTQILLTVQQMEESSIEDDQEIAENIQSNLFYEQATHERVINLLRNYKDQGRGYLDAVTELSHVFIRTLENYSKQNQDMQIRSRRRTKAKKRSQKSADDAQAAIDDESGGEAEAVATASRERKFDFARFSARFMTQGCVDTFVSFVKYYKDLNHEQLKRAHRFFYRVAFKLDLSSVLFRVDIIHLFQNMINGPEPLDRELSSFSDWKELIRQLFKKLLRRLEERPELVVEMLFSKIPSTQFYLEHGHVREAVKSIPKPPAELEVKPAIATGDQISVVTEALISDAQFDLISWVKSELQRAIVERESWEGLAAAREAEKQSSEETLGNEPTEKSQAQPSNGTEKPLPPAIVTLPKDKDIENKMYKNGKFRLLLTLIGFERISDEDVPGASWMIPSVLSAGDLKLSLSRIHKGEHGDTLVDYPDSKPAEFYIRRKSEGTLRPAQESSTVLLDSDGDESTDEALLFPAGGPTARKPDVEPGKKRRLKRHEAPEVDDETKGKKAEDRRRKQLDRLRKIKSDLMVHSSDEEDDEERDREFFAAEDERRKAAGRSILKAIEAAKKKDSRKRKSPNQDGRSPPLKRKRVAGDSETDNDLEHDSDRSSDVDSDEDTASSPSDSENETSMASQITSNAEADAIPFKEAQSSDVDMAMSDGEKNKPEIAEKDEPVVVSRQRRRAGFIIDDSDSD